MTREIFFRWLWRWDWNNQTVVVVYDIKWPFDLAALGMFLGPFGTPVMSSFPSLALRHSKRTRCTTSSAVTPVGDLIELLLRDFPNDLDPCSPHWPTLAGYGNLPKKATVSQDRSRSVPWCSISRCSGAKIHLIANKPLFNIDPKKRTCSMSFFSPCFSARQ